MNAAIELGDSVGKSVACRALGVPRASLYRRMLPSAPRRIRPTPARALDAVERHAVLDHLHSERFRDRAPAEVYATLIDEGVYLCSIRTMHRILAENGELKERRNQLRHPQYTKPELLATGLIKSGAGYHEAAGASQMDVLPPLRNPRYLQPQRGGLDGSSRAKLPSWPSG